MPVPSPNVPSPDPSVLTTEQLLRELANFKETVGIRFAAMDKATDTLAETVNRAPTALDQRITQLKELDDVKFQGFTDRLLSLAAGIDKQFDERDVRSKAAELAAQVAVGAALQAQKEAAGAQNESNSAAITKSESATVKQIDGILALLNSNSNALNDKIAVINGRLDRGEGKDTGSSAMIAMVIAGIAVIASVISVATLLWHHT